MKIFDCFMFFNELDLLGERLQTLDKIIERFVIVEALQTHQGNPKPLVFTTNMALFEQFLHKITHIVVDLDGLTDCWERQYKQFNSIMLGLPKEPAWVILSDVDEIPNPDAVLKYSGEGISTLTMDLYYYNLKTKCRFPWDLAKVTTTETLFSLSPNEVRNAPIGERIENGGKHCSYFGSPESIQEKLRSFAHQEYNTEEFTNLTHITKCISIGGDLFNREGVQFDEVA